MASAANDELAKRPKQQIISNDCVRIDRIPSFKFALLSTAGAGLTWAKRSVAQQSLVASDDNRANAWSSHVFSSCLKLFCSYDELPSLDAFSRSATMPLL